MPEGFVKILLNGIKTWANEKFGLKLDRLNASTGILIDASNNIYVNTLEISEILDSSTSSVKTWSSEKIGNKFDEISYTVASHIVDIRKNKQNLLNASTGIIIDSSNNIYVDTVEISEILDSSTRLDKTWSSEKIFEQLNNKSNIDHTHTAAEVHALPEDTSIPSKTSELINDSSFVTEDELYVTKQLVLDLLNGIINFTISGDEYQAKVGMKWEQWVDTTYNIGDIYIEDEYVYDSGVNILNEDESRYIQSNEEIINNYRYYRDPMITG